MRINKFLFNVVLVTAVFLHLGGLSAIDLKTMAQRQSFKQKVLADIRNSNWADAASGIQQFENSNLKRFAIDLRQAFAQKYTNPGDLPTNWPSSLKKREDRQQAKQLVLQALNDGNFATALAGIQQLPEAFRRDLYNKFVTATSNTEKLKSTTMPTTGDGTYFESSEDDDDDDDIYSLGDEGEDDDDDHEIPITSADDELEYEGESDNTEEAFISAARDGQIYIVDQLLQQGVDINATDVYGSTALMEASENGHKKIVNFLLIKKANSDIKDDDGKTAHDYAMQKGHGGIIHLLNNPPVYNPFRRELDI